MLRVGAAGFAPSSSPYLVAFERRMAELGYREGENFTFDYVRATGPGLAEYEAAYREVVKRNPDILFAPGPEFTLMSALAASQTTPIVILAFDYDPFAHGYAASLAQPGGRVTGLQVQQIELTLKRLQLLKEAIHDSDSAVVFYDRVSWDQWKAAEAAGAKAGLRLAGIDLQDPPFDYDRGLSQAPQDNRRNLFVLASPRFFADRERLAKFALRNRLASSFPVREWVAAGGLMSYGPSLNAMYARAADFVDRIARGAKPADLPIEQPTKFELVVNIATARALGLELSPTLLARADDVIE
jgi:putative ABC transport system substrate-binding protein